MQKREGLILPKGVKEVFQLMLLSLESGCRDIVQSIPESHSVYHPPNAEEGRVGAERKCSSYLRKMSTF